MMMTMISAAVVAVLRVISIAEEADGLVDEVLGDSRLAGPGPQQELAGRLVEEAPPARTPRFRGRSAPAIRDEADPGRHNARASATARRRFAATTTRGASTSAWRRRRASIASMCDSE